MRLRPLHPADLTPGQSQLYETILNARVAMSAVFPLTDVEGSLVGPFDSWLRSPDVGHALQSLGCALRDHITLPPRLREIIILGVATQLRSDFERYAHERLGRAVGLSDSDLAAISNGRELPGGNETERLTLAAVRRLCSTGDIEDATYDALRADLGETGLFELIALVGFYTALALQLCVFRVRVP